jgi:GNAT superfamily N-acetyltransferase
VKASHRRARGWTIGPTTAAELRELDAIISKPDVMRGCFGAELAPRHAREILWREWQSCQDHPACAHLSARGLRHGRAEVAGAGLLLDGELRFFVAPDWQRQGVGRALIAALRAAAELQRLQELCAWVFPENVASQRLLAAAGFVARSSMHIVPYERCTARPVLQYLLMLDAAPACVFSPLQPTRPGR